MEESKLENGYAIIPVKRLEPIFIKPETKTCNETYFLSILDHAVVGMMKTVYIYRRDGGKSCEPETAACDVIKQALSKVLDHYYPFTGRIRASSDGKLCVECNDNTEGVPFVEAVTDWEIETLGDITVPNTAILEKFVYDVPGVENLLELPLITAQVTRFQCGGLVLGLTINHCMADGRSAMEFVNSWAETARGVSLTYPPFLDRSVFMSKQLTAQEKLAMINISDISNLENLHQEEKMVYKSFNFDQNKLAGLKKIAMENGELSYCSSFTVLAALLWRTRNQALKMKPQQQTRLIFMVDIRSRLNKPLPKGFFGNGIVTSECLCAAGDLIERPFSFAVKMVQNAIQRVNEDYVRLYIDSFDIKARPSLTATLVISTWTTIPFSSADFGWGEPKQFGIVGIPKEVGLFIPDGKERDNGIIFVTGLPASAMSTFQQLIASF